MSSYNNFQSDNAKFTNKESRNNYNPEFNNTVSAKGVKEEDSFNENLEKYTNFVSWARWYPDLFLDLIKPKTGGIKLHPDQRTFLRATVRFASFYGVFPRGFGKTFNEVLAMFITAILFPAIQLSLTAQTKESASELLKDKHDEIIGYYPWFKNEIYKTSFSKNDAEVKFVNDSRIDILANSKTSLGQRRKRIMIEEAALLNDELFQDVLEPIVEVERMTIGELGVTNPEELNQQIHFFTTSRFRGSDEYARSLRMVDSMVDLKGDIVLGSDWQLGCWYGRGSNKKQIAKKKKNSSPIAFAMNYESHWVGSVENALVNINDLMSIRNLANPVLSNNPKKEYYLGVDVARSQDTSNNQTSISVLEVNRHKNGKINTVDLVNLINVSNAMNFGAQAIEVKRYKELYDARMVIVDMNGLGVGLGDALMKENVDPKTGKTFKAYNTVNTEALPDTSDSEYCLYDLKSQSNNTEVIVNFISMVESGKLRLLVQKDNSDYDINDKHNYLDNVLPFVQTDFLIEELANLQMEQLNGGKLRVKQQVKRINKDRYSSLSYGLWYINKFEDNMIEDKDEYDQLKDYVLFL